MASNADADQSVSNDSNVANSSLCAVCSSVNRRKKGRHCSTCNAFSHLSCVGITRRQSDVLDIWVCGVCLPISANGHATVNEFNYTTEAPLVKADSLLMNFSKSSLERTIPIKLPKGARHCAAAALSSLITKALESQSNENWTRLFLFACFGLGRPGSGASSQSLSASLKANLNNFLHQALPAFSQNMPLLNRATTNKPSSSDSERERDALRLRKTVRSKLMVHDVRAAVRAVMSTDHMLNADIEVIEALRAKHPSAPSDANDIPAPDTMHRCPSRIERRQVGHHVLLFW